ncbi:homogentisate 1,2-dioxygenase [Alkalihalobacillus alcalophilus ATCC 27647 = CGMCC 1.3604]|uniref:Homogentisate 1,2-dioxygenase n=1 Tax=Alkalihalobacillus alcalophilus ATCC 27647 = CGMCC 1.3604 TaxID=1218173 RepID=A0A094WQ16_ALKAL|nr:homogentisate 1,2-dioxygenase [Alkalihalobacillus alcalophilus]KGA98916.1 homogentisate 1,2-dioxygenase [Alkalihalobacillus alcalophilus ATCC 27647 = CGMCC 1.3604]MED1561947.1 homogentisate 1,2-dioxygenase [Alkalihalobacillus alcalophilus]THG88464.1 homogentisate 1,2-dioxygenase [Alkalihalobacillus alcalophilus ATCC 27647 = CGMCC 1.3604]
MPFYKQMGEIPRKRHTVFRKENGELYREQVMGTKGFSGIQSILYHHHPPTAMVESKLLNSCAVEYEEQQDLSPRHLYSHQYTEETDAVMGREYLLGNEDVLIGVVNPTKSMDYFYRNGDGDEVLFVHYGTGKVESTFGTLSYKPGDYIVIPIGTIYRVVPDEVESKMLVIETNSWITTPKRYRNIHGQLLEHSPFCERDFHGPEKLETNVEKGHFEVRTKSRGYMHSHQFSHHPLDVVGWDGYLFPYIFNVDDFEPITGRIHMPPPIHQTFEGNNFVICSFVPRMYDYHPEAIPAPYYHSNVDSDEVLYYVKGNFMSRKGVNEGSMTLHPSGIPHGPHPGKIEGSIGKKETLELAVMIDTFRPLKVVKQARKYEQQSYKYSWKED